MQSKPCRGGGMIKEKFDYPKFSADQKELDAKIKKMVSQINLMQNLLFEVKADSPIGKTVKILLNLFICEDKPDGLTDISCYKLAVWTGISLTELHESLRYLQQQGIISYEQKY